MDQKLELTKSQLEVILRLINDISLNGGPDAANKLIRTNFTKVDDKSAIKIRESPTNLSKKRSYSAIDLKNDTSNDELINESFKKSISNLINNPRADKSFPEMRVNNKLNKSIINDQAAKLRRNKSLIELKKEKWYSERNELKDSDSWYEKFDSFKKKPVTNRRSRSQPDLPIGYDKNMTYNRFESVSRMFSPISSQDDFDNESIATNNIYSPLSSEINLNRLNSQSNDQLKKQSNQRSTNNSSPNPNINQQINEFETDRVTNQPRRSFHRYSHQFNNIDMLEKRRKQQEYQSQLEAQIAEKHAENVKEKEKQLTDDRRLDAKIMHDQVELRNEFDVDQHRGTIPRDENLEIKMMTKTRKNRERKSNGLEKLEMKSKELAKVFKEASTQTEEKIDVSQYKNTSFSIPMNNTQVGMMMNRWQSSSNSNVLQPVMVRSNPSALLRTVTNTSKPKWTKQSNTKDEDSKTSILPRLNSNQKRSLQARKKWNS